MIRDMHDQIRILNLRIDNLRRQMTPLNTQMATLKLGEQTQIVRQQINALNDRLADMRAIERRLRGDIRNLYWNIIEQKRIEREALYGTEEVSWYCVLREILYYVYCKMLRVASCVLR